MGVTAKLTGRNSKEIIDGINLLDDNGTADIDVGEGGGKPSALGNSHLEPKHTIPEETKASYASVAAKSSKGDDNFRGGPSLDLEDVEELCGGSIESKDQPVAMELNPRGATGTEILPEDLYGPWMMVQSRRRGNVRQANVNQEKNESEKQKNLDEQSVEQATIKDASTSTGAQKKVSLKDAAYLASNPERKTKKNNLGNIIPLAADVVPLVSREEMEVIPHVIKQGNSKHKAITIVEPGFPANDTGNKRTGSWAHRMSDQLDEIGKSGQTGDVGIDGESNQDAQMGSPSDDDDHRSSDSIVDLDDEVTWTSSEYFAEQGSLQQRLDRCIANSWWISKFPDSQITHLDQIGSDHRPLLLQLSSVRPSNQNRPFRFIAAWQDHPNFLEVLQASWLDSGSITDKLNSFKSAIKSWNSEVFGHIGKKKKILAARLRGIDHSLQRAHNNYLIKLKAKLQAKFLSILNQEKSFWQQKACAQCAIYGDRNTKYFHASTLARRRANRISALKRAGGSWCTDEAELISMVRNFYRELFTTSGLDNYNYRVRGRFPTMQSSAQDALVAMVTMEEIKAAVFDMGSLRAPGLDGLQAGFY
ncbi:hypothetical protein V6N12_049864 [Hibiscus sabdariffa]|uniref:Reverse transcriptase n=1 Tax=Hibiscus sabdariffa TaxID=183260 RepID=A0ABR2GBV6_9ROSI